MIGLARTTPTSFVLMAADCFHHGGEFRPPPFAPLPDDFDPNPLMNSAKYPRRTPCPGQLFLNVHPKRSNTEQFYQLNPNDPDTVRKTTQSQRKLDKFDASEDVLVLTAHDADAHNVIDLYPKTINGWKSPDNDWKSPDNDWKRKLHWPFLRDFKVE